MKRCAKQTAVLQTAALHTAALHTAALHPAALHTIAALYTLLHSRLLQTGLTCLGAVAQVEASQSMIRIVGLSATLPNYKDVASFLGVPDSGLFYFDASYRPVPLAMEFVGTTDKNILQSKAKMDDIAFQKVGEAAGQL